MCCDCVCERGLSCKNAYACKFVSCVGWKVGGFLYETDAVMKSDNKGAIHNLKVTSGVNRALAGLAHTQTHTHSYKRHNDSQTSKQAHIKAHADASTHMNVCTNKRQRRGQTYKGKFTHLSVFG